jgi:hypothetical protein
MQHNDVLEFVSNIELLNPLEAFPRSKGPASDLVVEGEEQSFLSSKSLVSFASEVSEQNRKDILNSTLLAQLAANKKYPSEDQILDWYKEFVKVLSNLGWVVEGAEFSTFKAKGTVFELQNAIIDILMTAFGGNYVAIITKTLDAIKDLSDENGKITAFKKNTQSFSKGAFQIALAVEENNAVAMQLGTFLLTSSNEIKHILFFKSNKDETKLEYCSRKATLNPEIYGKARQAIVDKLGNRVTNYVTEIDIVEV